MEQVTVWHKVKKIHWNTNKHGKVVPSLQFTKGYMIEGKEYDGIALQPETISEKKIGVGSQIRVQHEEGFMLEVKDVRFPKDQPQYLWCDACREEVVDFECTNPVCAAKGSGPIVKLMTHATGCTYEESEAALMPYLKTFPISPDEKTTIVDLIDFLQFVRPQMSPRTALRKGILMNYEKWDLLWRLECMVFDWFKIENGKLKMPSDVFWDIANLRGLSARDYAILQTVNPLIFRQFHSNIPAHLLAQRMSKKAVNTILSAADAIAQVVSYAELK